MDKQTFESNDDSQMRAVGEVHGDAYLGDIHNSGLREITVSGVGGIPPNFQDYWVDRASYQTQLTDRLKANSVTEIVALGGFGKSSLAAWAHGTLRSQFDKRIWVEFGQPKSFDNVARWVLQEIGFPNKDPQVTDEKLLRELVYRLNDPNMTVKTLVVLDQVEAIAQSSDWPWFQQFLEQWAEQGQGSRVLVTTLSCILAQDPIALGGMNIAEGTVFFEREGLTGDRFAELIDLAGGHPLLLKLAAAWTKETYGARVDDPAIDFFGKLFANYRGDPTKGVEAIFGVIFEELPIGLQDLLCGVSVYRLPFGEAMAQAIEPSATIGNLELLGEQGLLLAQGDGFTLHPLVAELVRSRVTEEARVAGHEGAIGYYSANFRKWDGTIESCRGELESFYHACELRQYQRAHGLLDRCLELLVRADQWRALLSVYDRLTTEWQAADYAEAESLGSAWTQLGNLHHQFNDVRSAISAHQQAQAIFDQIGFSQGLAVSLGNLGIAYRSLGQYQQAIDCHQKSLEIARGIGDCLSEANSLGSLGIAYDSLGQYQRAIDFLQQTLKIMRKIGDRWGEGSSLFNMANALAKLDKHDQALLNFQQAQAIYEDLELDHIVEQCKKAINDINTIIAPKYQAPNTLAIPKAKPQDDWWERNLPANERKAAATQQSSSNFWWLFTAGFALALLIYWLRR